MEELSALRKQVSDLCRRRSEAIDQVMRTKPYIAAQVYERYTKCGKAGCRCGRGELHGPFLWIYQNRKGQKVVSTTVVRDKGREAKELAERYSRLLRLRQVIRESDQKINELLNQIESLMEREVTDYVTRKEKA